MKKVEEYASFCSENGRVRLANAAGFCRFCRITRSEFAALRRAYPRGYDLALSTFLDEAINTKSGNSAQSIAYLQGLTEDGEETGALTVVCGHDAYEDGA